MPLTLLADLDRVFRDSWGPDTCAPEDLPEWHPGNPTRGQCGTTALVLHDLVGGDLVRGEVHVDGRWVDYHWWNRLPGGVEIDLTREQFAHHEMVIGGEVVSRPAGPPARCRDQYETLRHRVFNRLGIGLRSSRL